ncbi:MFS transporter [Streptomyces sp. SL13]|uniref:MFS transporter n=1 Tax=Streptantibioticus silvisoli TaxID=2705255 RepID=A0AA90HDY4_9ACTN|nr:MFS transporter [Streptantibioticus silvisoli]MDI5973970.1 MFS transporter [Streptantibioticus silvisoli]
MQFLSTLPSRHPLRNNAGFRRLFFASAFSLTGDWFAFVALNGFVYHRTGSPGWTALLFAVNSLPGVLLLPVLGPLTDRLDRRRLRVACDVGALLPVVGLFGAFHTGSVALAMCSLAGLSVCGVLAGPIPEAALPNLVPPEQLSSAQAALGSLYSAGLLVGAGLGGVVTAAWGPSATLAVDGASFLVSAALIASIRASFSAVVPTPTTATASISTPAAVPARPVPARARLRPWGDMSELWRFVRSTPIVAALLWLTVGLRLCYGMVGLLPVYALGRFHAAAGGVGALYLAQGAGAVLGPLIGRRIVQDSPRRRLTVAGGALAVFGLGYLALAQSGRLGTGMAAALVGHIGVGACAVLAINGLQLATPDAIRGRVMVLAFGLTAACQGVSSLAVAPLTQALGPATVTRLLGLLALVCSVTWTVRTTRNRAIGIIAIPATTDQVGRDSST